MGLEGEAGGGTGPYRVALVLGLGFQALWWALCQGSHLHPMPPPPSAHRRQAQAVVQGSKSHGDRLPQLHCPGILQAAGTCCAQVGRPREMGLNVFPSPGVAKGRKEVQDVTGRPALCSKMSRAVLCVAGCLGILGVLPGVAVGLEVISPIPS